MTRILILLCLAFALLGLGIALSGTARSQAADQGPTGVIRVIDGDTFDVGTSRVRLYGIDAPEGNQSCETQQGVTWACGTWVSETVRAQYQGRQAQCAAVETDRYGRIVARCAVDGRDIGQDLVAQGLAFAYRRYAMDYDLVEKQAALTETGLWAMRIEEPAAFRRAGSAASQGTPAPGDCVIKGNISAKGERIYHVPGQEHYARTRINTGQGERWFCTAAEARAAGWRAARR